MSENLLKIYATVISKTINEYPSETIDIEFKEYREIAEQGELYIPSVPPLPSPLAEDKPLPFLVVKTSPLITGVSNVMFPAHITSGTFNSFSVFEKNEYTNDPVNAEAIASYGSPEATLIGKLATPVDLRESIDTVEVTLEGVSSENERLPEDYYNRLGEFFEEDTLTNWVLLTDIDYPEIGEDEDSTPVIHAFGIGYLFRVFRSVILSPEEPIRIQLQGFLNVDVGADRYLKLLDMGKSVVFLNSTSTASSYGITLAPVTNVFFCDLALVGVESNVIGIAYSMFSTEGKKTENDGIVPAEYSSYPKPYITVNSELNPIPGGTDTYLIVRSVDTLDLRFFYYSPRMLDNSQNPLDITPSNGIEPTTSINEVALHGVTENVNVIFKFTAVAPDGTPTGEVYTKVFQIQTIGYRISIGEIIGALGGAPRFDITAYPDLTGNLYYTTSESNKVHVEVSDV